MEEDWTYNLPGSEGEGSQKRAGTQCHDAQKGGQRRNITKGLERKGKMSTITKNLACSHEVTCGYQKKIVGETVNASRECSIETISGSDFGIGGRVKL